MTQQLTVILGWGSLLWDRAANEEFDRHHHDWLPEGPLLKLEFSKISRTRLDALTLVLDPTNGTPCQVHYALSKREDPEDAICDLRTREGTTRKNIGYLLLAKSRVQSKDTESQNSICKWAQAHKFDVVVWTDFVSDFEEKQRVAFTPAAAIAYLEPLPAGGKAKAAEYVSNAPSCIRTPLREALERQPWFAKRTHI